MDSESGSDWYIFKVETLEATRLAVEPVHGMVGARSQRRHSQSSWKPWSKAGGMQKASQGAGEKCTFQLREDKVSIASELPRRLKRLLIETNFNPHFGQLSNCPLYQTVMETASQDLRDTLRAVKYLSPFRETNWRRTTLYGCPISSIREDIPT